MICTQKILSDLADCVNKNDGEFVRLLNVLFNEVDNVKCVFNMTYECYFKQIFGIYFTRNSEAQEMLNGYFTEYDEEIPYEIKYMLFCNCSENILMCRNYGFILDIIDEVTNYDNNLDSVINKKMIYFMLNLYLKKCEKESIILSIINKVSIKKKRILWILKWIKFTSYGCTPTELLQLTKLIRQCILSGWFLDYLTDKSIKHILLRTKYIGDELLIIIILEDFCQMIDSRLSQFTEKLPLDIVNSIMSDLYSSGSDNLTYSVIKFCARYYSVNLCLVEIQGLIKKLYDRKRDSNDWNSNYIILQTIIYILRYVNHYHRHLELYDETFDMCKDLIRQIISQSPTYAIGDIYQMISDIYECKYDIIKLFYVHIAKEFVPANVIIRLIRSIDQTQQKAGLLLIYNMMKHESLHDVLFPISNPNILIDNLIDSSFYVSGIENLNLKYNILNLVIKDDFHFKSDISKPIRDKIEKILSRRTNSSGDQLCAQTI